MFYFRHWTWPCSWWRWGRRPSSRSTLNTLMVPVGGKAAWPSLHIASMWTWHRQPWCCMCATYDNAHWARNDAHSVQWRVPWFNQFPPSCCVLRHTSRWANQPCFFTSLAGCRTQWALSLSIFYSMLFFSFRKPACAFDWNAVGWHPFHCRDRTVWC